MDKFEQNELVGSFDRSRPDYLSRARPKNYLSFNPCLVAHWLPQASSSRRCCESLDFRPPPPSFSLVVVSASAGAAAVAGTDRQTKHKLLSSPVDDDNSAGALRFMQ